MALNFPNSPTNGQIYTDSASGNRWVWDSGNTCWVSTSTFTQTITVASSAPGSPVAGQLWWNKDYGRLLVYYTDDNTSQWVDASPSDATGQLAYNNSNAAFGVANTALQNTNVTLAGNLTVTGNVVANKQVTVTYTPATTVNAAITLAGANTQGGTGYADFLKATNLSGGTNPNKTFRLNSTGGIEVVNSAYTALIMSLGDDGSFGVGSRGISKSSMPAGAVLQVVSATKTDTWSTTTAINNAGSDGSAITGLSVSITPTSSTSKIYIVVSFGGVAGTATAAQFHALLFRNSTKIGNGVGSSNRPGINGSAYINDVNVTVPLTFSYLDSPATTSAITYSVNGGPDSGGQGAYVNRTQADNDTVYSARKSATITVMEIAV